MKLEKRDDKIGRLVIRAGNIVEMLKDAFRSEKGLDMTIPLVYAAGDIIKIRMDVGIGRMDSMHLIQR